MILFQTFKFLHIDIVLDSHNKQLDIIANNKEALFPNFLLVLILSKDIHVSPYLQP